ncbi:MAG: hypothetical protein HXX10_21800 [Rhodoplanes sp.]|uniref:hypothetical protein n=1 Tax=Rhodoplanes sp. TaxID=1968906 RepID=UPI00183D0861|nr:hypothetical protein [Rhodoplanes sp.]NVO16666.1 hypothetical protein [Rhodoplanes sp.]
MLPTFRSMLVAIAAVVVAAMVLARGLVPAPDAVTRIGEVPILGRTLVRLSQVPMDDAQRLLLTATALRTALADAADASSGVTAFAPVAESGARPADGGADAPTLPLVAADERSRAAGPPKAPSADPLGDLIRAVISETPEPAPRETMVADETPPPAEHGHMLTTAVPDPGAPVAAAAAAPVAPALGFAAEPARPRIALPLETDPAPVSAETGAPAAPAEVPAVAPPSGPAVAAVTSAAPSAATPQPPAAKAAQPKAKRAAKPVIRKKPRVVHSAPRRAVLRSAPAPAPQAKSVVYPTYQTYSPFGGPVQATPTGAAPATGARR